MVIFIHNILIVYITLFDDDGSGSSGQAAELSSLVDSSGYWYANLGNARTADLSGYFNYSAGVVPSALKTCP